MGKTVYRPTGSRLLGEELRRLRGRRTLTDMVELSRSPAFAGRIRPIAQPTLSQIETGISMPTLESLNTLAAIYRVSAQRLLNLVTEERMGAHASVAEVTADDLRARWMDVMTAGRASEALAVALRGESSAATDAERATWRVRKARAMHTMGLRDEAVSVLLACVDEPAFDDVQRVKVRWYLAGVLLDAANISGALDQIDAAERLLAGADAAMARELERIRVRALLIGHDCGRLRDEHGLHEVMRLVQRLRREGPADAERLWLDFAETHARELLGNKQLAARRYAEIEKEAAAAQLLQIQLACLINLGLVHRASGHAETCIKLLRRAETLASELKFYDWLFAIHFELSVAFADSPEGAAHLRRCEKLLPLVNVRSKQVVEFERKAGVRP